jgi:hypothetical protein
MTDKQPSKLEVNTKSDSSAANQEGIEGTPDTSVRRSQRTGPIKNRLQQLSERNLALQLKIKQIREKPITEKRKAKISKLETERANNDKEFFEIFDKSTNTDQALDLAWQESKNNTPPTRHKTTKKCPMIRMLPLDPLAHQVYKDSQEYKVN